MLLLEEIKTSNHFSNHDSNNYTLKDLMKLRAKYCCQFEHVASM